MLRFIYLRVRNVNHGCLHHLYITNPLMQCKRCIFSWLQVSQVNQSDYTLNRLIYDSALYSFFFFFKCKTMSCECCPMTERYHVTQVAFPSCQLDHKPRFNQKGTSTNHKIKHEGPFWHICMLLMINKCHDFKAVNINSHDAFP